MRIHYYSILLFCLVFYTQLIAQASKYEPTLLADIHVQKKLLALAEQEDPWVGAVIATTSPSTLISAVYNNRQLLCIDDIQDRLETLSQETTRTHYDFTCETKQQLASLVDTLHTQNTQLFNDYCTSTAIAPERMHMLMHRCNFSQRDIIKQYPEPTRAAIKTELITTLDILFSRIENDMSLTIRTPSYKKMVIKTAQATGQLAMHCTRSRKLKEAHYLIQTLKGFCNTAFALGWDYIKIHFNFATAPLHWLQYATKALLIAIPFASIRVAYATAQLLHGIYQNSAVLQKDLNKLLHAYKHGKSYTLGKALVHTANTLLDCALANKNLRNSFKIATKHGMSKQFVNALRHGIQQASRDHEKAHAI